MDGYTLGLLIRQLIEHAGLATTLAVVALGGVFVSMYKATRAVAGFFSSMLERRDAVMAQTMANIAASDARRSENDAKTAEILAGIKVQQDNTITELRSTRAEMSSRMNKMQEDVTTIRGAVS